eukprot:10258689-Karenia_brevis.AAC.1
MEKYSNRLTPVAMAQDSKTLWQETHNWEKAKADKTVHHQKLMESKKKEVDMLKSILESKEQELLQMEQAHAADVKQMDS